MKFHHAEYEPGAQLTEDLVGSAQYLERSGQCVECQDISGNGDFYCGPSYIGSRGDLSRAWGAQQRIKSSIVKGYRYILRMPFQMQNSPTANKRGKCVCKP